MGMFDEIRVECPLPHRPPKGEWWQTKALLCQMDKYLIDTNGRLWMLPGGWKNSPKRRKRVRHTGGITFYAYDGEVCYEYQAWFRHGVLRDIVYTGDKAKGKKR